MSEAKNAVLAAGVLTEGHFVFADGDHATTKLEMDALWDHKDELITILKLLAMGEGLPPADIILGVPTGGQRLALGLVERKLLNIPVVLLERVPGGSKQDFRFVSEEDRLRVKEARSVRIYEDVVTTLSSVAGVVRLLDPSYQEIHSLAIWRRGEVKDTYRQGVTDHYLIEEPIISFSPKECPVCVNK